MAFLEGLRDKVKGLGLRVEGLGFRVEGLGFRVEGLGFRVSDYCRLVIQLPPSFAKALLSGSSI